MSLELINNLGKRFHARYAKTFAELNSKVIKALDENGGYDVPTVVLDDNGFSESIGLAEMVPITALVSETNVARAQTKTTKFKPIRTRYVIRIPWSEVEATHNNPEYFNEYFDKVIQSAITKYQARYGDYNKSRYGEVFMDYVNYKGEVFRFDNDGSHLDLYFEGKWASNELV